MLQDRSVNEKDSSLLWHLQGECAKLSAGSDCDGVNVLTREIMALAKGKAARLEYETKQEVQGGREGRQDGV